MLFWTFLKQNNSLKHTKNSFYVIFLSLTSYSNICYRHWSEVVSEMNVICVIWKNARFHLNDLCVRSITWMSFEYFRLFSWMRLVHPEYLYSNRTCYIGKKSSKANVLLVFGQWFKRFENTENVPFLRHFDETIGNEM